MAVRAAVCAVGGACAVLCCSIASATSIADSQADFSGVQGQGGWYYGFYEGTLNPSGFQQFPLFGVFAPNFWSRTGNGSGGYWTLMSDVGGHPSGTRGILGRQRVVNWAVRRFVFAAGGNVTITGRLRKVVETCGNGVTGRIFVNGTPGWTQSIAGNDTTGVPYTILLALPPGSVIDWAIDPVAGDEECDYSVLNAVITWTNPCPADLNGDRQVDDADFIEFLQGYNVLDCADPAMPPGCPADLNGDALVDDEDFVVFVGAYNELVCP